MLREAGLGVAFRAHANASGPPHRCSIEHGDLTALLFLQGYRRDEFVQPEALRLEAQRHEAQVALAVDQEQDRLLALPAAPG